METLVRSGKTLSLGLAILFLAGPLAHAEPDPESLLRRGALREALVATSEAARTRPEDVAAQELYIDMLLTVGLAPRAQHEFAEVVRSAPTDPDSQYLLGRATVDPRAAQQAYETALRLDPDHARSHMGIAAVHLALGRAADAEAAYQRAVERDRTLGEAWLGLVRVQVMQERAGDALTTARLGLQHVPDEPGLYLTVALLDASTALQTLQTGVARVPDEGRLHEALAEAQLASGDFEAALNSATSALTLDPTLAHAQLARLYARELSSGWLDVPGYLEVVQTNALQGEARLKAWNQLARKYPRSALVLVGRGAALQLDGNAEAGRADLVAAAALDADNEEAAAAAGLALLRSGDAAGAQPLLQRAIRFRPWDASLGVALAQAMTLTGDQSGSILLLQQLVERHVFHVDAHVYLAQALVDAKRAEEAYALIAAAVDRLPDPRLGAAFVLVATEAGHYREAAEVLDQVVASTGNTQLAQAAARLRELASGSD